MHELFADPVVMRGLNREPVSELDETRAMIEGAVDGWRTDGLGPFILETATNRRMVGQAGLMIFDTRGWIPKVSAFAQRQPRSCRLVATTRPHAGVQALSSSVRL
jgi:hypothetical protein